MKKSLGIVLGGYAALTTVGYNILNRAPQTAVAAAMESAAIHYDNHLPRLGFWNHPEISEWKDMSPEEWDSAPFEKRYDETSKLIRKYIDHYNLESYGHRKDVLESVLEGILYTESRFDRKAVSETGDWGLFQLSQYVRSVYIKGLGDLQIADEQENYFYPPTNIQAGVSWFGNVALKEAGGDMGKALRMYKQGNDFNNPEAHIYQKNVQEMADFFITKAPLKELPESRK